MRLSPAAVSEIQRLGMLRLDLAEGGCCGTYYQFSCECRRPGDLVLAVGAAELALSPQAAPIVAESVLDFGANLKPPRFRLLRNPNAPLRCPCGRSFGQPYPGRPTARCQAYWPMPWFG
jgi:iron-sulfur cluster assembly accessory protein